MYKRILATVAVASMAIFSVAFAASQFSDVPADHWAADSISWANEMGLMTGPADMPGMFDPAGEVNRAQLATVLHRYDEMMMDKMEAMIAGEEEEEVVEEEEVMEEEEEVYTAELEDVSGGTATGMVTVTYTEGSYMLEATFDGLPELEGDDFYEGWIVKDETPMSTGVAEMADGSYMNSFESEEDLTDYTLYVLTLEPNDGDDAPSADHILEGTLMMEEEM